MSELGFVVTPDEILNRVNALDAAVQKLDAQIEASKASALNVPWREQWHAFTRRWAVERDAYASWGARLFATRVMPRLEAFESAYRWWAQDFERRTGKRAVPAPRAQQAGLVPSWVWALTGAFAALVLYQRLK